MLLKLTLLALLPSALRAQAAALLKSPAESNRHPNLNLAEQYRLLRWTPSVPPPEWKCWGMGNGARDWRHAELGGCHIFMAHEANFNGTDILTLTSAILANGTELVSVDLAGSDLTGDNGVEALGEMLSSDLNLEQVNLEKNGFDQEAGAVLAKAIVGKCPARLRLGWNSLGPEGGEALAAGLVSGRSGLRELSLEKNALADDGAVATINLFATHAVQSYMYHSVQP